MYTSYKPDKEKLVHLHEAFLLSSRKLVKEAVGIHVHQLNLSRKLAHVQKAFLVSSRKLVKIDWYSYAPAKRVKEDWFGIQVKLAELVRKIGLVFM